MMEFGEQRNGVRAGEPGGGPGADAGLEGLIIRGLIDVNYNI